MRNNLIERLNSIKITEDNFKNKWWVDNFFSYTKENGRISQHISDVSFEILNDDDLLRLFEYIIAYRNNDIY